MILNKVTGIENESIHCKISKLDESLKDLENIFKIRTSSLISREKFGVKKHRLKIYIAGYRKLMASDHFLFSIVRLIRFL